jgi:hypothetical protein
MNSNPPILSVVIPTYNRKEIAARLISSIRQGNNINMEIIVVDDASTDGTRSYIQENFSDVVVIRNDHEKLLAASRNMGIIGSRGKYVFAIDDDNVVQKGALEILVEFMNNNPNVGICAPLMLYYDDPVTIWCAGIRRNYYTSKTTMLFKGSRHETAKLPHAIKSDDFPNALFIRRDVFSKIGFFNENEFPMVYDEADFCRRASLAGFEIMSCTRALVWHDIPSPRISRSKTNVILSISSHALNPTRLYYMIRNRIVFHRKYNSALQMLTFAISMTLFTSFNIIKILRMHSYQDLKIMAINACVRGIKDGVFHKTTGPHRE